MLDLRRLCRDPEAAKAACRGRGIDREREIDELAALEESRRGLLACARELRTRQNQMRLRFPVLEREGKSTVPLQIELRLLAQRIKELEAQLGELEERRSALALTLPNFPAEALPSEEGERELKRWGEPAAFAYAPKSARRLGEALGILAPAGEGEEQLFRAAGARLLRALENHWLDVLSAGGLTEWMVPSDQIPNCSDCGETADAQVLLRPYRDCIYPAGLLPMGCCAALSRRDPNGESRREISMTVIAAPGQGGAALERMTERVMEALGGLGLPGRVVSLPASRLPFSAACAHQVEIWMPSRERYEAAAVLSDCGDFLSRRIACRCRRETDKRPRLAETAHGSVALFPLIGAILENCQDGGGSVTVPEALRPAIGTDRIVRERRWNNDIRLH